MKLETKFKKLASELNIRYIELNENNRHSESGKSVESFLQYSKDEEFKTAIKMMEQLKNGEKIIGGELTIREVV
jgi:hypothetical protein